MGASFTNYQARTTDADGCAKALVGIIKARALLTEAKKSWITIYDEKSESQDLAELQRVAKALSAKLATEVFAFLLHDSDVFIYLLYQNGRLIDQFNSNPDYFGPVTAAERRKWAGHFEKLTRFARAKTSADAIARTLAKKHVFHEEMVGNFAQLMGIDQERACAGFRHRAESGSSLRAVHGRGHSPEAAALVSAVEAGRVANVRSLLANGVRPDGSDRLGQSLLVNALRRGRTEIALALLEAGADPFVPVDGDAVWAAAAHGNREVLSWLLQRPSKPLEASLPAALTTAVMMGQVETVEDLLNAGADPNRANEAGSTPLMTACFRGPEVIWEALAGQSFPSGPGRKQTDWPAMVRVLLEAGAEVNARDKNGMTALMMARSVGQSQIVEMLLQAGADPSLKPDTKQFEAMVKAFQSSAAKTANVKQEPETPQTEGKQPLPGGVPAGVHLDPRVREAILRQLEKQRVGKKK